MELEASNLTVFKAASFYDVGKPCAAEANSAKYLAPRMGGWATQRNVTSSGICGNREFRAWRL
jgi:acyl-CoA dehydrogenase